MRLFCFISPLFVLIFLSSCAHLEDKRLFGVWQSGSSHYGKIPWDLCLLTINANVLSTREYPSDAQFELPYKTVLKTDEFTIIETLDQPLAKNSCDDLRSKRYFRFENRDHSICLNSSRDSPFCKTKAMSESGFAFMRYKTKEEAVARANTMELWMVFFPYESTK